MMFIPRGCVAAACLLAAAACLPAAGGCQWVPQSKFDAVQRQNRMLLEQQQAGLARSKTSKSMRTRSKIG